MGGGGGGEGGRERESLDAGVTENLGLFYLR